MSGVQALFLDKMPNIYVNLKKKIEISHLRGSVDVYLQVMYLFYSNTASYR